MRIKWKLLLGLTVFSYSVFCQSYKTKEDWFVIGYGKGFPYFKGDLTGQNLGGAYCFNNYRNFYKRGGIDVTYRSGYRRSLFTFYSSIGKKIQYKFITFNIDVGPGLHMGRTNSNKFMITPGLNANIDFYFHILKDVGIGFELFSDANFIQSTHGFRIGIMGTQPIR